MFWNLFIFRRHSTREPASIACDNEQGDLFYSAGSRRKEPAWKKPGRGFGKNEAEWTRNIEIKKKEIPGSGRSMHGYILTYVRF